MDRQKISNVCLTFWTPRRDTDPPTVAAVQEALSASNLNTERTEPIPPSTAFRRACNSLKTDEIKPTFFTSKRDDTLTAQFDHYAEDDNGRMHRTFHSMYKLDAESETPLRDSGTYLENIDNAFQTASAVYTWADVTAVIKEILAQDAFGAYSPKTNGGVYYVPTKPEAADLLTRLDRFCSAIGMNLLVHDCEDSSAQREEIANAICDAYNDEVSKHADAVGTYTTDTRPGIMSNRREMIQTTYDQMQRLRPHMNGRYEALRNELGGLLRSIATVEAQQQAAAAAETARQQAAAAAEDSRQEQLANEARQSGRRAIITEPTTPTTTTGAA